MIDKDPTLFECLPEEEDEPPGKEPKTDDYQVFLHDSSRGRISIQSVCRVLVWCGELLANSPVRRHKPCHGLRHKFDVLVLNRTY
jgi:hypothetical protein